MLYFAHFPSFPSLKLSKDRDARRPRPVCNEWIAADRYEWWWQIVAVTKTVAVFSRAAL
jgi:hypothetical protein